MGHSEPKTIKEPKVIVKVEVNYQEPVEFTDAVDMGEVPEGKYTPPPNEIDPTGMTNVTATTVQGAIAQLDNLVGGGYTEPTILGQHKTINASLSQDQVLCANITIPNGGNGTYEIEAKVRYGVVNASVNNTLAIIKNGTIQSGVLVSDTFSGEGVGQHSHFVKYYINNLVATDTISLNLHCSIDGNTQNSVCQLTAKKLQNTVTISPDSESGGGGA